MGIGEASLWDNQRHAPRKFMLTHWGDAFAESLLESAEDYAIDVYQDPDALCVEVNWESIRPWVLIAQTIRPWTGSDAESKFGEHPADSDEEYVANLVVALDAGIAIPPLVSMGGVLTEDELAYPEEIDDIYEGFVDGIHRTRAARILDFDYVPVIDLFTLQEC